MKIYYPSLILIFASSPAYARGGSGEGAILFWGLIVIFFILSSIHNYIQKQVTRGIERRKSEMEYEANQLKAMNEQAAENERNKTRKYFEDLDQQLLQRKREIEAAQCAFEENYIKGRKWLANYIAEAFAAPEKAAALDLENKKHPAQKAAEEVRRVSEEKRELRSRLKYLEYTLKTYHEYYPILEEYSDDILNEQASLELDEDEAPDADRVVRYVSKEDYAKLSPAQRNQLALEKWRARKKSNVEIGRIYERYLGYLYEQDGWNVAFIGALEGLEDMGRDLLCVRDDRVHVVQAKYWANHKIIHEKHIFQLFGTTLLLPKTHPHLKEKAITSVFATTTTLSDTAAWAAISLGVKIKSINMEKDYPVIKCNINNGNQIYHLPFDQQYDRVRIISSKGEMYVGTTAEAEAKGFRRAKKFYGY